MKRFSLILGALLLAAPLPACSPAQLADTATTMTSTSPVQDHGLAAATNAYTVIGQAVIVYVKTAKPSAETKARIAAIDNQVYAALVEARTANARGNSPAMAAAMSVLKSRLGEMRQLLAGLGVPIPSLPAF